MTISATQVQTREQAEYFWSKVPPILANPLNSVIASAHASDGLLSVKGYAVGGPAGQVKSVSVSVDDGATWQPARITYQEGRWSWTLWEVLLEHLPSEGVVYSRAIDREGNKQEREGRWNMRGVAYNPWGRGKWKW